MFGKRVSQTYCSVLEILLREEQAAATGQREADGMKKARHAGRAS
tara:strand:- start:76 stop:210 length:135 start_codon:yes stop_codon:yes gene_type:complete